MSSIEAAYNEKRDFIRMRINSQVNIRQAGKDYEGICKDLSGTGMLIQTNHAFSVGSELQVSIEQKIETHLPFNAIAEVTRVDSGSNGNFTVGLAIKEIND